MDYEIEFEYYDKFSIRYLRCTIEENGDVIFDTIDILPKLGKVFEPRHIEVAERDPDSEGWEVWDSVKQTFKN